MSVAFQARAFRLCARFAASAASTEVYHAKTCSSMFRTPTEHVIRPDSLPCFAAISRSTIAHFEAQLNASVFDLKNGDFQRMLQVDGTADDERPVTFPCKNQHRSNSIFRFQ
jgi:hypothetical protein